MNNQKQLSLGILMIESQSHSFPGFANNVKIDRAFTVGTGANTVIYTSLDVSWVVLLLPHLEREDLYRNWLDPAGGRQRTAMLREACCPSDPPGTVAPGVGPLAYVVNCGCDLPNDIRTPHNTREFGVFFNQSAYTEGSTKSQMSMAFLRGHDGSANTLMMSERIFTSGVVRSWDGTDLSSGGFLWAVGVLRDSQCKINQLRDSDYLRPSSFHPGGVVATFCDGHQQFLSEQISYLTYEHLMTPDGAGAGNALSGSGPPPQYTDWVNRNLIDQFNAGKPPPYDPDINQPPNLANTVLDTSAIQ